MVDPAMMKVPVYFFVPSVSVRSIVKAVWEVKVIERLTREPVLYQVVLIKDLAFSMSFLQEVVRERATAATMTLARITRNFFIMLKKFNGLFFAFISRLTGDNAAKVAIKIGFSRKNMYFRRIIIKLKLWPLR